MSAKQFFRTVFIFAGVYVAVLYAAVFLGYASHFDLHEDKYPFAPVIKNVLSYPMRWISESHQMNELYFHLCNALIWGLVAAMIVFLIKQSISPRKNNADHSADH